MNKQSIFQIYDRLITNIDNDLSIMVQLNNHSNCEELTNNKEELSSNIESIEKNLKDLIDIIQILK